MATRFYFHAATNGTSGLPTTEQSSLTVVSGGNADALTLNRSMNTTIGTSQVANGVETVSGSTANYYYGRFVSQPIYQSSVAANTWTYNFAAHQLNAAANFPVNSTNKAVRITCYVWRPGTGKIGDILDGISAATVDEGGSNETRAHHVTFAGSQVTGVQNEDVIIFEAWFVISPLTDEIPTSFRYDGTTVNTTDNASVSNHASFLETPEDLALELTSVLYERAVVGTAEVNTTVARRKNANRSLIASAQSSAALVRRKTAMRPIAASAQSSAALTRRKTANRSVAGQTAQVQTAVVRRLLTTRSIATATVTIETAVARLRTISRSINATAEVASGVVRMLFANRSIAATAQSDAALARLRSIPRSISESITISVSVPLTRMLTALRSIAASATIASEIAIEYIEVIVFARTIDESVIVGSALTKIKSAIKTIGEVFAIQG